MTTEEWNDIIRAVSAQRDAALNNAAQMHAKLMAVQRELEELKSGSKKDNNRRKEVRNGAASKGSQDGDDAGGGTARAS